MTSSSSNLLDNLAEGNHKLNVKIAIVGLSTKV